MFLSSLMLSLQLLNQSFRDDGDFDNRNWQKVEKRLQIKPDHRVFAEKEKNLKRRFYDIIVTT